MEMGMEMGETDTCNRIELNSHYICCFFSLSLFQSLSNTCNNAESCMMADGDGDGCGGDGNGLRW